MNQTHVPLDRPRPWNPPHPPRIPLVQRPHGETLRALLAIVRAPWPDAVVSLKVEDGRLLFIYE